MSGSPKVLNRSQKAAAVLLSVGSERAAKVLAHLGEEEVEQLTVEIATLGDLSRHQVEGVLGEFHDEALAHAELVSGGEKPARELMRRLRGPEADAIVDRLLATTQSTPFHFVRMHEPSEVLQHLRDEHPQTIALVLAHLPPRLGARLLSGLAPDVQTSVATRLAALERAAPEVVRRVEEALRARLGEVRPRSGRRDGVKELAQLLNQVDNATERTILGELEAMDPALAERVRALMFLFEDLITVDDRSLQELLRAIDTQVLAVAMKGTSPELREVINRSLSARARSSLEEEMDLMGPVRIREVEEAQNEVVRTVQRMEKEGVITVSRGGQEEFIA